MSLLLPLTLVCMLALAIRPTFQQACIPIAVRPVDVDLDKSSGIWYEYLSGPPGPGSRPDLLNIICNIQRLGFVNKNNLYVEAHYEEIQYYILAAPELGCLHTYFQSNRSVCGNQRTQFWVAGGPADGVTGFEDIYIVYSDPDFLEIYYRCANADCSSQYSRVRTRKNPNELSVVEKSVIGAIVDVTLGPYCLGAASLNLQPFNASLPDCGYTNRPAGYLATLNAVRAKSNTKCDVEKIDA